MGSIGKRKLGRSGIEVVPVGLGCWAIGGKGWGEIDDNQSVEAIRRGLDLGANLIDTADVYGLGRSEKVIARALQGRKREDVVIATKFCWSFDEETQVEYGENTSPEYIRKACNDSLRRLNTDYIDLYQFHHNHFGPEGAEQVRDTLEELVTAGKIRSYGWSTDFPNRARIFAQGPNCTAMQFEMNVIDDSPSMVALCEELNQGGLNRGPLAMGLLTGKFKADSNLPTDDVRGINAPEWMKYFKDGKPAAIWLQKVEAIREILTSNGRSVAQGALAWLLTRSAMTLPIPGFKTVAQVEDNMGTLDKGLLTAEQMHQIDELLERHPVSVVSG
jgi:aryl-alcohol dehydrogenase-like predicted oxidoreductase